MAALSPRGGTPHVIARSRRSPSAREAFNEDSILDLIVWNAPDHEHTRIQLRGVLEEIIGEQFDIYDMFGGDAAQGLTDAAASSGATQGTGTGETDE